MKKTIKSDENVNKAKSWNDLVGLVSKDGKYELII